MDCSHGVVLASRQSNAVMVYVSELGMQTKGSPLCHFTLYDKNSSWNFNDTGS